MTKPAPLVIYRRKTIKLDAPPPPVEFGACHVKVEDRSCGQHKSRKPQLGAICAVFQELCDDPNTIFGNGITKEQAKLLAALSRPMVFMKGEVCTKQGEPVDGFFIIISGELNQHVVGSEYKQFLRASVIGEIGLLDGLDKAQFRVTAVQDTTLATLPYKQFNSFLVSAGSSLRDQVLNFLKTVQFPELMRIEGSRMSHAAATRVQCAIRQSKSIRKMVDRRHRVHLHGALILQRAWKYYLYRLGLWRELRAPFALRLQCNVRVMLGRRRLAQRVRLIELDTWYRSVLHHIVRIQFFFRMATKAVEFRRRQASKSWRKKTNIDVDEEGVLTLTSPMVLPSSEGDDDLFSPLAGGRNSNEMNANDAAAMKKWLKRDMHKCFSLWRRHLKVNQNKRYLMKAMVKSLKFGGTYRFFKKWKTAAQNLTDIVTPWNAKAGERVYLSPEGKDYEFTLGRRLKGDDDTGFLVAPMLSDKTVWKVRWESSGLIGTYFSGSCGRYFLRYFLRKTKKNRRRKRFMEDSSTLTLALGEIREAFENNEGLHSTHMVTPPFGANIGFGCPSGSEWKIEVNFLPKSVTHSVAVHVRAIEASEFGVSRNEMGIVVSPFVEIRHRNWKQFNRPFTISIPHRCSSASNLFLLHWPDEQISCGKVQGAVFTDEGCKAEVTSFGLYAVISTNYSAPDIVYGKLDVGKRWRDSIGKLLTRMCLGATNPCRIDLIPRGCAVEFEGANSLLPRFHVMNGTMIEKVEPVPEFGLEGCMLNCWSGRVKYKGGHTTCLFSIIVQTIPTEPLPFTMPLFDCAIELRNPKNKVVAAFENGNHVRMKVTTVQLCIQVEMPPPLADVHFECMLQGRETLRDIRMWAGKCFAGAKIDNKDLDWLTGLRFLGRDGHEDELIPLNVEHLDPASNHLPKIKMVRVEPSRHGSETPEDAITRMSFDLFQETRCVVVERELEFVKLAGTTKRSLGSTSSSHTMSTPFIGCPSAYEVRKGNLAAGILSRDSICESREQILASKYQHSFSGLSLSHTTTFDDSGKLEIIRRSLGSQKDTTRRAVLSQTPRIRQMVMGPPRTAPGELQVDTLARINRTLQQYGCITPRRQQLARLRQIDPQMRSQITQSKLPSFISPRTQRILEHRQNVEQFKAMDTIGSMFPYPPGSNANDKHAFVTNVISGRKVGPKSPPPLVRSGTSIFTTKQRTFDGSESGDSTPMTPTPQKIRTHV